MCAAISQQFCVRWNSHLGSLGSAFPEFLSGQNFVDVTLACEGHQLHCHRIILASCSSYFSSLLRENPCKHPIIILPRDIKLWEIQALVDFMYRGHVNVSQTGLPDLLKSAEILQIRGLSGSEAVFNLNQSSINNNSSGGGGGVQSSGMHSTAPSSLSSSPSFNNGPNDTNLNANEQTTSFNTMSPGSNSLLNEIATSSPASHQNTSITNGGINSPNSLSSKDRRISISETQYQEANSSVVSGASAITNCNNIITPKEEPLDNVDESIINASTNSPPEEDDDSYIGKYSDFLDQSDKQEILPLQQNHNQTEQQEQEQNNSNQQQKSQRIHQLQQFKKILTNNKNETNEIQLNLEKRRKFSTVADDIIKINNNNTNNTNDTIVKCLDNKRLSISSSSNLNLTNNDEEINDGNASDSSDTSSIFIVEPEIPLIEINDILDENFENNLINTSDNDIGNQLSGIKTTALTKDNITAILNKRNSKASSVNNNDKSYVNSVRISGNSRKVKENNNGKQMKSQIQKDSSNTQKISSILPPFLKFNSESMSIYVKPSSDHHENINSLHNSSVTIEPSTSKSTINLKRSNLQRKQIQKNDNLETIKMEYEINSGNNIDFENIECVPNVHISYNNIEDEQNEFSIVETFAPINYDDIQIDENYYSNPGSYEYPQTPNNIFRNLLSERMGGTELESQSSNNNNNNNKSKKKQKTSSSLLPSSVNQNFMNGSTPSPSAVILRSPRCNQPRSYSTDALYAALMDVKAGKSIYRASQVHNVPRKTLRNWMKRWHIKSAHPMPRQLKQAAERKKLKQLLNNGNK